MVAGGVAAVGGPRGLVAGGAAEGWGGPHVGAVVAPGAIVADGAWVVTLAATAVVGTGPTSVREMTCGSPEVAEGPGVGVRVGEGVALGGEGLSPGARVG